MKEERNKVQNCFRKYKFLALMFVFFAVIGYIVIYLSFAGEGFISSGKDLDKSDWLSFVGAYLSFIGTAGVSLIALFQSSYYNRSENERREKEHRKCIQPIFSVNIIGIDTQIGGTAEVFNLSDPSTYPKHKNIELSIENVNNYPIKHIIIFDKYICPLLKSNETKNLQCAYFDSIDAKKWKKHLIIITDEFERNENGIPKWFNISYEDIDGYSMFQTFELKCFDDKLYYSLEGIYET